MYVVDVLSLSRYYLCVPQLRRVVTIISTCYYFYHVVVASDTMYGCG